MSWSSSTSSTPDLRLTTPVTFATRAEHADEPNPAGEGMPARTGATPSAAAPQEALREGPPRSGDRKIGMSMGVIDEAHRDQQVWLGLVNVHLDDAMVEYARPPPPLRGYSCLRGDL